MWPLSKIKSINLPETSNSLIVTGDSSDSSNAIFTKSLNGFGYTFKFKLDSNISPSRQGVVTV